MRPMARLLGVKSKISRFQLRADASLDHLLGLVVPVQGRWVEYNGLAGGRISPGISALQSAQRIQWSA